MSDPRQRDIERLKRTVERVRKIDIPDAPLVVRYYTSGSTTYSNATTTVINFDTPDYDPFGLVTTGAAWHFTVAVSAWYDTRITNSFTHPGASAWTADNNVAIDLYKNGSYLLTLVDFNPITTSPAGFQVPFTGNCAVSLTAGDTLAAKYVNHAGFTATLVAASAIEIYRVT